MKCVDCASKSSTLRCVNCQMVYFIALAAESIGANEAMSLYRSLMLLDTPTAGKTSADSSETH